MRKPNVSENLAIELAFRIYGLKVNTIKKMVSYNDQNFHICVSKEHRNPYIESITEEGYTLKITNTRNSAETDNFDIIHSMMYHLNLKGLRVPVPIKNLDGNTWKMEEVPLLNEVEGNSSDETKCGIHLLTFLPGVPISTVTYTSDLLFQWGALLASYHDAIQDFRCEALFKMKVSWSLENIPKLENFMDGLDEQKKNLVLSVLKKYPEEITESITNAPKCFIHGDFNENNILVQMVKNESSDYTSYSVEGTLDFEDVHYGTYAWDIGVMLAYAMLDCTIVDPLEGAGHALAGYLSIRSLSGLELSLLKMCIACRLCQSLVLGAYSYKQDPGNSYIIISARSGWNRLEQICNISNEDLLNLWEKIQQQYNN
ncbi:hydroxylysine kinase-like [Stegodyphus dumicola]|uniref:hydroxylysine kinase-like n=1 Tax=Stegodyphus dumicola TaxID=202533 RepID=UPI0015B278A9|nr:hydroxylysine kinase-like [Stegodyphus dumicola]